MGIVDLLETGGFPGSFEVKPAISRLSAPWRLTFTINRARIRNRFDALEIVRLSHPLRASERLVRAKF